MVVRHWTRLPREFLQLPFAEMLKSQLGMCPNKLL